MYLLLINFLISEMNFRHAFQMCYTNLHKQIGIFKQPNQCQGWGKGGAIQGDDGTLHRGEVDTEKLKKQNT